VNGSPTERFRRVDAVFDAVLDLPTAEQPAFLDRACADDPELRTEVLQLLRALHRSGGFLDSGAVKLAEPLLAGTGVLGEAVSDRIGPFRVVREIGQGGMGRVFLGERADGQFDQRVALKLIRHGAPSMVHRFLEERRILALLEHPHIARLIDGGITADGLPYFAMEFVDGEPIDRYCDARSLSLEARLTLFMDVCEAVSWAHQHLVIHRDLKPSNILVTQAGQVKLLDFGIAKWLRGPGGAGDQTRTEFHAMTPEYAAPEQMRAGPVSTATDVYSLGVLLYVLLAGERPYDLAGKSMTEMDRIVCEYEPSRPSAVGAAPWRRRLRGDLDLIVMKALHKEPSRRYQSPAELAEDLQRFREGQAVRARPDSARYRLGKFVRRNRAVVLLTTATALALVGATAFSTIQMREARTQRQEALREAKRATAMSELQAVLAGDSRDPDGRPLSATGRISVAEGVVVRRFQSEPWLVAVLLVDLSNRYLEAGDLRAQRGMLGRARTIARDANAHNELALAACTRATSYWIEDILDSARADVDEAKAALAAMARRSPDVEASCLEAEGKLLQATGQPDSGIALLERALALVEAAPGGEQRLGLANSLAEVLRLSGRTREAVPYFRRILRELEAQGYGDTEAFPNVVNFLVTSLLDLGEFADADSTVRGFIREREAKHGEGRVPTPLAFEYARVKINLKEMDSADLWLTRALRDTSQGSGVFRLHLPSTLADLRLEQGRLSEARAAAGDLLAERRGQRATTAMLRARLRRAEGDARGASAMLERELGVLLNDGQPRLTWFALPLVTAGEWRLDRGDPRGADSLALLARAAAAIDSLALVRSANAGRSELLRARALRAQGALPGAREAVGRAMTALASGYGAGSPWTRAARLLADSLSR
jgi:serine/threonine-protein kinase